LREGSRGAKQNNISVKYYGNETELLFRVNFDSFWREATLFDAALAQNQHILSGYN